MEPELTAGGIRLAVDASESLRLPADPEQLRAQMVAGTVFKHTVSEDDVVATALFLCSSAANSLTGQDINVSAGAVMF